MNVWTTLRAQVQSPDAWWRDADSLPARTAESTDAARLEWQALLYASLNGWAVETGIPPRAARPSSLPDDLVTPTEASRLLGVSRAPIVNAIDAGKLRAYLPHGAKCRKVSIAEARMWQASRPHSMRVMAQRRSRLIVETEHG